MSEPASGQRDIGAEFKGLRLLGMASAWAELMEQGGSSQLTASRWLVEHLLQAEEVNRNMRSIAHQTKVARFPLHRDLAGFDFQASEVDKSLVLKLADLSFTQDAQNVVLIGGPGTGKTHLATALGISGLTHHAKRVRFYSTVDLVNALEQEKAQGKAGRIALSLMRMDLVVLDELGYLPFSQAGGALLFHLLSKLYEHTSVLITTIGKSQACSSEEDGTGDHQTTVAIARTAATSATIATCCFGVPCRNPRIGMAAM